LGKLTFTEMSFIAIECCKHIDKHEGDQKISGLKT